MDYGLALVRLVLLIHLSQVYKILFDHRNRYSTMVEINLELIKLI